MKIIALVEIELKPATDPSKAAGKAVGTVDIFLQEGVDGDSFAAEWLQMEKFRITLNRLPSRQPVFGAWYEQTLAPRDEPVKAPKTARRKRVTRKT